MSNEWLPTRVFLTYILLSAFANILYLSNGYFPRWFISRFYIRSYDEGQEEDYELRERFNS